MADPRSLDPHRTFENKSDNIIAQIFEGLLRFDAEGALVPALALSCESLGTTTVRCWLREGVRFHDGEPMDAEAVRWSISHQIDPATGYPALAELSTIKEVRVAGPMAVDIETHAPDGLLLRRLAAYIKIVPPKTYQADPERFGERPIGTGPFRFSLWTRGRDIELEANPGYWQAGVPKIKRVEFSFAPEDRQLDLLFKGEIDLATEIPATRTLDVMKNRSTRVLKRRVLTTPLFWFAAFEGPLGDRRVRQALNYAVDKEQLIRYAVLGNGEALASLSMAGEYGRNPKLEPYAYSEAQARRLLQDAGVGPGVRLKMLVTEQASREARIIAAQWKKAGVETDLRVLPMKDAYEIMLFNKEPFDVVGNLAPNPTAHMYFLPALCFHSRSPFSRLRSQEFDRRYAEIVESVDQERQEKLARQFDAWLHEEALGVFTYQKIRTYAASRDLEFQPQLTGMLDLRDARWR